MIRRMLLCGLIGGIGATAPAAALAPAGEVRQIGEESITQTMAGLALLVRAPSVAWDPGRERFLVTWRRDARPVEEPSVRGRFVNSDGTPDGEVFRVAAGIGGPLAHNPVTGGFGLVSGGDLVRLDEEGRVLGRQRFSGAADPLGPGGAGSVAIAVDERTGAYLVAWLYAPQRDAQMLLVRYMGPGGLIGDRAIPVVPFSGGPITERSFRPSLVWNPADGGFLVSWSSEDGVWDRRLAADGTPVGDVVRISDASSWNASTLTRLPGKNGFLAVWGEGVPEPELQSDLFARRVRPDGLPAAGDARRITHITSYDGRRGQLMGELSAVAGDRADELLVVADVDHLVAQYSSTQQTFAQALTAEGLETGPDDLKVSGDPPVDRGDAHSAVAYAPAANRYLVAWAAVRNRMEPLDFQVRVRVLDAGPPRPAALPATAATPPVCRQLPQVAAGTAPERMTLSTRQARITMRVARAALRRAEAAERWLDAGLQERDLCQGAIGARKFRVGSGGWTSADDIARTGPDPRPVEIARPGPEPRHVRLDAERLTSDQGTARRAIALVAALERRLDAGLTGGDIADGAVGRLQLAPGFRPLGVPDGPVDSTTAVTLPTSAATPGGLRVTLAQMRVNQRIARAALLRADALIRRLEDGIGPDEIRDGTLTAGDLAPGVRAGVAPGG